MRKDFTTRGCAHDGGSELSYEYVTCKECGAVGTDWDASWGVARAAWFDSIHDAKMFKTQGRLPEYPKSVSR